MKYIITAIMLCVSASALADGRRPWSDHRHWRDRLNNSEYYRDRNDDGRFNRQPVPLLDNYYRSARPRSEDMCWYRTRIDAHGEKHISFICP
jgi:hypothetical protein